MGETVPSVLPPGGRMQKTPRKKSGRKFSGEKIPGEIFRSEISGGDRAIPGAAEVARASEARRERERGGVPPGWPGRCFGQRAGEGASNREPGPSRAPRGGAFRGPREPGGRKAGGVGARRRFPSPLALLRLRPPWGSRGGDCIDSTRGGLPARGNFRPFRGRPDPCGEPLPHPWRGANCPQPCGCVQKCENVD